MAFAVDNSASMRVSASAIQPFNASTVVLMPFESDLNSSVSRISTRASKSPSVMRLSTPFVSSMRRTTTRLSSKKTIAYTAASNNIAESVVHPMRLPRPENTMPAVFITTTVYRDVCLAQR